MKVLLPVFSEIARLLKFYPVITEINESVGREKNGNKPEQYQESQVITYLLYA